VSLRPGSRFEEVYRTGVRVRRGAITVFAADGQDDVPEVGVVAGRRVGGAVKRNRAKRRLREAARRAPLGSGRAYVVVASPEVVDVAFEDLVEWLDDAVTDGDGRVLAPQREPNE